MPDLKGMIKCSVILKAELTVTFTGRREGSHVCLVRIQALAALAQGLARSLMKHNVVEINRSHSTYEKILRTSG